MKPPSLSKVLAGGWVLAAAMSGAESAEPGSPPPVKSESNSIEFVASDGVFQTFGSGSQRMNEMRARLKDPQQRAILHEQQRQGIADNHYGVADALQLDAATFDKLMALLAEQQMEDSEYFYETFANPPQAPDPMDRMRSQAERITRHVDAQREILGQEKLERYQRLRMSHGQRGEVRRLDERLGASDKLTVSQRERLVELLHDQLVASLEQQHMLHFQRSPLGRELFSLPSAEELQRQSQLMTIASNEQIWRDMPESHRQLRERAAEFLSERQLATLAQLHAEQEATRKQQIEQMRVAAGLSATIPEQPEVTEVPPARVDRDVKLSIKATVQGESPRYLTTVVSSGKSVSLKIAEGLFLEATPIVFENDAYNLQVQFFETGVTGKRLIGNRGQSGKVVPAAGDERALYIGGGGGGSLLTGSKGYAVDLNLLVEET
jgi:hypothetical protein